MEHECRTFLRKMFQQKRWIFKRCRIVINDKAGYDSQKFQGPLCHDSSVSTFQKRWVAVLGEHNPFDFVSAGLTINSFHRKPYWQGFVGYSIAIDKRFLNNIINIMMCVLTVSSCWSQYVENCSSHPASSHPRTVISYAVFPFPGGNQVLAHFSPYFIQHLCVGKSIGS